MLQTLVEVMAMISAKFMFLQINDVRICNWGDLLDPTFVMENE